MELLHNYKCKCGKIHTSTVDDVIIGSGVINQIPTVIKKYNAKKVFLIADVNTFQVAGQKVVDILSENGIDYSKFVFSDERLEPDEKSVGSVIMHYNYDCDIVIGVGSGVINDISKIVSCISKNPYIIVATAPSMDGYASQTSSMNRDGLKTSLPSKNAEVIIGDIDILKTCPIKMMQAGLGDMLAKYISICEWRISNLINGEYYCEFVADIIRKAVKKCVENAKGLLNREDNAVQAVFEGLVLGGIAMNYAGCSRPASGIEHYFSHIWDMRGLEFNTVVDLHGVQCAVATKIVAGLYEKVLNIKPNKDLALEYVNNFDYSTWSKELSGFLGNSANAMIENEKKEGKYDKEKHQQRLKVIISNWDKILEIIKEEVLSETEIDEILDLINAPKTPKEIGINCDLTMTFKATKDIRDKYILSRLLWDIGIIDKIKIC